MAKRIKTGGREPGTPNRITKDVREILKSIVEDELMFLPEKLRELEVAEINLTGEVAPPRILSKEEAKEFLQQLEASC